MKFMFYADAHLRSTVPEARLDDYLANQDALLLWMKETFSDYVHLSAGDTVHLARERAEPITFATEMCKKIPPFYGIWGNHDLLYHNYDLRNKTTLGILSMVGVFNEIIDPVVFAEDDSFGPVTVYGYHYGQEIQHVNKGRKGINIALFHAMVMQEPHPHIEGYLAEDLLKEFPEYDIIITGDNHKQFVVSYDGRVLINPGSLKRDNADQVDHVPRIFTYDAETNEVGSVAVPTDNDIIDREHLDVVEQRDSRLEALSEKFKEARNITLDFYDNVIMYLRENDVSDGAELRVLEWIS